MRGLRVNYSSEVLNRNVGLTKYVLWPYSIVHIICRPFSCVYRCSFTFSKFCPGKGHRRLNPVHSAFFMLSILQLEGLIGNTSGHKLVYTSVLLSGHFLPVTGNILYRPFSRVVQELFCLLSFNPFLLLLFARIFFNSSLVGTASLLKCNIIFQEKLFSSCIQGLNSLIHFSSVPSHVRNYKTWLDFWFRGDIYQ